MELLGQRVDERDADAVQAAQGHVAAISTPTLYPWQGAATPSGAADIAEAPMRSASSGGGNPSARAARIPHGDVELLGQRVDDRDADAMQAA